MKSTLMLTAAIVVAFCSTWFIGSAAGSHATGVTSKNLLTKGDIQGSMAQARQLMAVLQSNNWDISAVDRALLRVPDQIYPEIPELRERHNPTFIRGFSNLGFFSDLYVQHSFQVIPGREGVSHADGFWIVGYKDGTVTQVPAEDVRLYPEGDHYLSVFPGMPEYANAVSPYGDPDTYGDRLRQARELRRQRS